MGVTMVADGDDAAALQESRLRTARGGPSTAYSAVPLRKILVDIVSDSSSSPALIEQAGAVLDVGLRAFYPTKGEQEEFLRKFAASGCCVELNLPWPMTLPDEEEPDPRFERLQLLTMAAASRNGWRVHMGGCLGQFGHVLVDVPAEGVVEFLTNGLAQVFASSRLGAWEPLTGCREPEIAFKPER
jgi:hypothetical protein